MQERGEFVRVGVRLIFQRGFHAFAETQIIHRRAGAADNVPFIGEQRLPKQAEQRGQQLAVRQVAGRAENDDAAGFRRDFLAKLLAHGEIRLEMDLRHDVSPWMSIRDFTDS